MKYYKLIIILIIIIVLFGISFIFAGFFLPVDPDSSQEMNFVIKKGQGVKEIADNLENQDLIRNSLFFKIYVWKKGAGKDLKAGSYLISKSMTLAQIIDKFVSGEVIKNKITILEGWNLRDIGWYFENQGMFMAEELFELIGFPAQSLPGSGWTGSDFTDEFDFLKDKPRNVGLEGYLFPDTYELFPEASLEEIVKEMLSNFGEKLTPQLREEIFSQGRSIFEIITMASLLEKEVRTLEDKKLVAGVLWKRLEIGMPLQVDATIVYITGRTNTNVLKTETRIDSPYNTYKYKGLPLGPIANPGIESILAALEPKDSPYFYYLSTPAGKTIFSRTLEEHNIAKAKYLK